MANAERNQNAPQLTTSARLDHAEHGGALLLGVDGVCVIGHGSSKALSVLSALRLAHSAASHGVMANLHALSEAGSPEAPVACD